MSYRWWVAGIAGWWMSAAPAVASVTPATPQVVTPSADVDWLPAAEEAGRPVATAVVPLPAGTIGSFSCVALVLALRFSRHRRWVTLR